MSRVWTWMMRGTIPVIAVAIVLIVPGFTIAGSQADPEVIDPAGDGQDSGRDIVKAWVEYIPPADEETPAALGVFIETATTPTPVYPALHALSNRFTLWFKPTTGLPAGKTAAYLSFRLGYGSTPAPGSTGQPLVAAYLGFTTAAGTFDNVNTETTAGLNQKVTGKVFSAAIPLTLLKDFTPGADSLKELYANVVLNSKGPATGLQGQDINTIHSTIDRAPNTGFGRDWTMGTLAAAEANFTLSTPANLSVKPGQPTDVVLQLVNNGSAANVSLEANASSPLVNLTFENSTIELAEGASANVTLTIQVPSEAENQTTVSVSARAGNFTQNVTFVVTLERPAASGSSTNATSNETAGTAKAADGGGIPALPVGLVVVVLVGVAAALVRRRRL